MRRPAGCCPASGPVGMAVLPCTAAKTGEIIAAARSGREIVVAAQH